MSHIAKLTPEFFDDVKRFVRWHTTKRTATKFGISEKTALQVRGSNTYMQYRENVKAQHPEVVYSLRERVLELHSIMFDKKDGKYIQPQVARVAIEQIIYKVNNEQISSKENR